MPGSRYISLRLKRRFIKVQIGCLKLYDEFNPLIKELNHQLTVINIELDNIDHKRGK